MNRFERIDGLRWFAINAESPDFLSLLSDKIVAFEEMLVEKLTQRFGDKNVRKAVPEWHKLVGSTPELHDVDPEIADFVIQEIIRFITSVEEEWSI